MRVAARIVLIVLQWVLGVALIGTIGEVADHRFGISSGVSGVIYFGSLFSVAMYWSWRLSKLGKGRDGEQPPAETAAIRFEPNARKLQRR